MYQCESTSKMMKGSQKVIVRKQKWRYEDPFATDSDMSTICEGKDRDKKSKSATFIRSISSTVTRVFKWFCTYIYLFLMKFLCFEKWCLHDRRRNLEHVNANGHRRHDSELYYQSNNYETQEDHLSSSQSRMITRSYLSNNVRQRSMDRSLQVRRHEYDNTYDDAGDRISQRSMDRSLFQVRRQEYDNTYDDAGDRISQLSYDDSQTRGYISEKMSKNFWQACVYLFRTSLVILLLLLLWTYGEYLWGSFVSGVMSGVSSVGSASGSAISALTSSFSFLASLFVSSKPVQHFTETPTVQPVEVNPSSVKTEYIVKEINKEIIINKESEETLTALKANQETTDELKIKLGIMEGTLRTLIAKQEPIDDLKVKLGAMEKALKTLIANQETTDELKVKLGAMEGTLAAVIANQETADELKVKSGAMEGTWATVIANQETTGELKVKLAAMEGTLATAIANQETTDELKVKLRAMEETLRDHEARLKLHDQSFTSMDSQILNILITIKATSAKEKTEGSPLHGLSIEDIELMIKRAISKYDADKTGLPDLALESAGGSILSTRCTKSSELRNSVISYWGFRLWSPPNTPRTIIQPGVVPGECWAFEGSVGDVVIKLAVPSIVTAFTLEHIPKTVSRNGHIDSAPKHFQVLGLQSEHDTEEFHDYGTFMYDDNDEPLQYFNVHNSTLKPYPIVELKILSNHGNMKHTCIYRFRVHGAIDLQGSHVGEKGKSTADEDINQNK